MVSERVQRQVDALLDRAESAIAENEWDAVAQAVRAVLAIDSENADAQSFLAMAEAAGVASATAASSEPAVASSVRIPAAPLLPDSFVGGRYRVERFLGEGGKKRAWGGKTSCGPVILVM